MSIGKLVVAFLINYALFHPYLRVGWLLIEAELGLFVLTPTNSQVGPTGERKALG